ncbi:MAG: hypothetical protein JWP25_7735 [Bradyrhizobium sp.]|jgi:hydroxypyruvate isomerase|nr:hypothetical protein [Bradyrhizobium sp.]
MCLSIAEIAPKQLQFRYLIWHCQNIEGDALSILANPFARFGVI